MSGGWTDDELRRMGDATELHLASRRGDGSLRPYVTMWTVRAGDDAQTAIDEAYHAKYDSYGPQLVGGVVGADAHRVTLRLVREHTQES